MHIYCFQFNLRWLRVAVVTQGKLADGAALIDLVFHRWLTSSFSWTDLGSAPA